MLAVVASWRWFDLEVLVVVNINKFFSFSFSLCTRTQLYALGRWLGVVGMCFRGGGGYKKSSLISHVIT